MVIYWTGYEQKELWISLLLATQLDVSDGIISGKNIFIL